MSKRCTVIGITGGISTGKSTVSNRLSEKLDARLFDADKAGRELVDQDSEVQMLLRQQFGDGIFYADGSLNRGALRAIVFSDREKKRALEHILHPRIRRQWATEADLSRQSGEFFLADIPLLYETKGETLCDCVVVVACAPEIQLQRLMARAHLSAAPALEMINAQMLLTEKISRADHLIWNNGPVPVLEAQVGVLARLFLAR